MGETPQLFSALLGLRRFYFVRGQLQAAHELGEQLFDLAQSLQEADLLVRAHLMLGETLYFLGEFAQTREHAEQGITLYDPQQHRSHALLYGNDPGMGCLNAAALASWMLGYPDQALKRSHEALTLAQGLSRPFSLATTLTRVAWLYQYRREWPAAQEYAEAAITLSAGQGFMLLWALGTIIRGWALVEQGEVENGIAQIHQGLDSRQTIGAEAGRSSGLAYLAEAHGKVGQLEEGLALLTETLAMVDKNGARFYEAELYRLKGTLTLQSQVESHESKVEEAEECFSKAIEVARRQQAKSWELRAVMSLSRLWQRQGKEAEALQILTDIYGWFTEGFDTTDLLEAKALLEELT